MKTNNQMSKLVATAAIALASVAPSFGQSNLGAACGCPPVSARTTVTVSTLPGFVSVPGAAGGELTLGGNWTCDKTYILDQKIYVNAGSVLVIQPGTIIKGTAIPSASLAAALIIERGAKIIAAGTQECPIVFTAEADPVDNTYSLNNTGKWGGVVILGKATNNLTAARNGTYSPGAGNGKLAIADGLGVIEGFATSVEQDRFGANLTGAVIPGEPAGAVAFDDNDNSGILKYVSIRHSGAILAVGNEINGLTLGSVGRGTIVENIETVSCGDDNIEIFGGTVNIKYISVLFGNDDMIDYDLGWTGKGQFIYGQKSDNTWSVDSDNGFEADSDDQKSCNLPRSTPVFYNVTLVGNSKTVNTVDNSGQAAIMAKELTGGEINNSIFANWKSGLILVTSLGTRTANCSVESYTNWSTAAAAAAGITPILKVKCNTFINVTNPIALNTGNSPGAASAADNTQFTTTDLNTIVVGNTLPGFDYNFAYNATTNAVTTKNDVVPNPALSVSGCPVAPVDGFFVAAPYRGAFASTGDNWLSKWSYSSILGLTKNTSACASDINKDGVINVNDFLLFGPLFGTSCN